MAKEKTGGIAQQVEALVRPAIEALGLRLWDVRFEKEGPDWFLRVWIDRDTPLDTDACEEATRAINPILDEADPISQSYYLEVGSPGLGRKLTRDEHFAAKQGQKVAAHLIRPNEAGEREVAGLLLGKEGNVVRLQCDDGAVADIAVKDASSFKLCDDEDLF
jgi:ribosome maturation factor RimP